METKITKQEFEAYEAVRRSGVTSMFAITLVADLSGLTKEKIKSIMQNYSDLRRQFPDVRQVD